MYLVWKIFAGFIFVDESKSAKCAKIWRLENLALYGSKLPQNWRGMYPGRDVTFNFSMIKLLSALRGKAYFLGSMLQKGVHCITVA